MATATSGWLEFDVTAAPSSAPDQAAAGLPVDDAPSNDRPATPGPPLYPLARHFTRGGLAALALASPGRMCRPQAGRRMGARRPSGLRSLEGRRMLVTHLWGVLPRPVLRPRGVAAGVKAEVTPSTAKAKDKGANQETGELPGGAGFEAEMAPHPPTTDVASAERKARLEDEKAVRLQAKFDNYRFYHEAFNHRGSTVQALIDEGLVSNTARPPGFSCAAC